MKKLMMIGLLIGMSSISLCAQEESDKLRLSGSLQSDMLLAQKDSTIGAEATDGRFLTNTYLDLKLSSRYVEAGARLEYLEHPLPGYESDFKGWGVPYAYLKGRYKNAELTLGSFYEQFGSGFILRSYEERSLGIDNSLQGARLNYRPWAGVAVKVLTGRQRRYWNHNKSWMIGADVEWNIDELFKTLQQRNTYITLGASYLNKHERDEVIMVDPTHRLHLPLNVNAFDVRLRVQHRAFNVLAEMAMKSQDPSHDNGYIYRNGYVAMLSGSYSKRGMSLLLQAKRSTNMGFRSRRGMEGISSFVNHLPPFTMEHTYTLAALYPYATRPDGEWAYQAAAAYTFPKGSPIGGKYGTTAKVNFSHVHSVRKNGSGEIGTDGYGSPFWAWGDATYYQDIDVQLEKRLAKDTKLNLMYMYQRYNQMLLEGHGGMLNSHIFVADVKQKLSPNTTLRVEAQYLASKDGDKDWLFGLGELSLAPHWMFTLSDLYNVGNTRVHYYQGYVTYSGGAHRLQLGYGRTRAGFNCSGGICRYIPATKGLTLSYNYNF
ncbi:DUF6029 family protein [Prevotella melaninogenica]|uniref:TonB-dependent receptor n=1 Tax=Prevotella melaninogenica TaxID=28132 RepID=A0A7D4FTE3_9BACT|nr:DUF6029 family protein [Prevotella melaninogenica]EFC72890.1 hypothetical protein HMPREF0660_01375 [Prevotella melaninogenica D18]QKH88568.1 hypothetical protein FIU21_06150 [Prevotella melaninogenica]